MNRLDKIGRLVTVGFSATQLSRADTDTLNTVYESAKPLMVAQREELILVARQENRRAHRAKEFVNARKHATKADQRWHQKWKPLPPITMVGFNVRNLARDIRMEEISLERNLFSFRQTGERKYADAANACRAKLRTLQGQFLHFENGAKAV